MIRTKLYSLFLLIGAFLLIPALAGASSFIGGDTLTFIVYIFFGFVIGGFLIWLITFLVFRRLFRLQKIRNKSRSLWITLLIVNLLTPVLTILAFLEVKILGEGAGGVALFGLFHSISAVFLLLLFIIFSFKKPDEKTYNQLEGKIFSHSLMKTSIVASSVVLLLLLIAFVVIKNLDVIFSIFDT